MTNEPDRFTFYDPVNKRKIIWKKDAYNEVKIKHPEVRDHLNVITKAIENPDQIRRDKDYKSRKIYYACFSGDREFKNQHMKVVVENLFWGSIVFTAYFVPYLNSKEELLWSKT